MRGREHDRLCKKTKVGTLGRMPLASDLTLCAHIAEGRSGSQGRQFLTSSVQLQPCKDPEDCPSGQSLRASQWKANGSRQHPAVLLPNGAAHQAASQGTRPILAHSPSVIHSLAPRVQLCC